MTAGGKLKKLFTEEGTGGVLFTLFFVYAALIIAAIFYHEPWQDEGQAWLLANAVHYPGELLQYMKYEGSPMLWHAVLWVFAKAGAPFYAIQILNAAIMIGAAAIVVYATRLPLAAKIGVLASYPFLFEYGAISRSYGLMTLLMIAVAAMHSKRLKNPLAYGLLLLLLSQTTFFGLIAAVFFAGMHFEAALRNSTSMDATWAIGPLQFLVTIGTVLLLLPNADVAPHLTEWNWAFDIERVYTIIQLFTATFFPLPPYQVGFWNGIMFTLPVLLIGVAGALLSLIAVRRSRFATGMYLFVGGGIFAFLFMKGLQRVRFYEAIFIVFIMAVILLYNEARFEGRIKLPVRTSVMVSLVLFLQLVPSVIALRFDITEQFSPSREIAAVIEDQWREGSRVLSYPQTAALSTFAQLQNTYYSPETFYSLDVQEERPFALWSAAYYDNAILEQGEIANRALGQLATRPIEIEQVAPGPYFLLSETELTDARLLERFSLYEHYSEAIVDTERLYVYIAQ